MKKALAFCLTAVVLAFGLLGCKRMQAQQNTNTVTNTVLTTAFNDESYVWENWQFSTNKVDSIDKLN